MLVAAAVTLAVAPQAAAPSLQARAAVRQCLSFEVAVPDSLAACRQAVAFGLPPEWSAQIRAYLARRLAALARWDEVIEIYRGLAAEQVGDAEWARRLGAALLFGAARTAEAETAFREALRRDDASAESWALLGCALAAMGHHPEAVSAFERAESLDADCLKARPGLAEVFEAARRGETWP